MRLKMRLYHIVFCTIFLSVQLFASESLPDFGSFPFLKDMNVLKMQQPFETRYYFVFKSDKAEEISVFYDFYHDEHGADQEKDRVIISIKGRPEYLVKKDENGDLYSRLPKKLLLGHGGFVGISLQECVSIYERLLSELLKGKNKISSKEESVNSIKGQP